MLTVTRFACRHKPTDKWVYISMNYDEDTDRYEYEIELVDDFTAADMRDSKDHFRNDLRWGTLDGVPFTDKIMEEFEFLEIEITYTIKETT